MDRKRGHTMSYLLRLWQAGSERGTVWRASLQCPRTGQRTGFPSLESLFNFLRQQTGAVRNPDGVVGETEAENEGRQR